MLGCHPLLSIYTGLQIPFLHSFHRFGPWHYPHRNVRHNKGMFLNRTIKEIHSAAFLGIPIPMQYKPGIREMCLLRTWNINFWWLQGMKCQKGYWGMFQSCYWTDKHLHSSQNLYWSWKMNSLIGIVRAVDIPILPGYNQEQNDKLYSAVYYHVYTFLFNFIFN